MGYTSAAYVICFGCVWAGLAIATADALLHSRRESGGGDLIGRGSRP